MDRYYAAGNSVICPACYQQIAGGGTGAGFVRLLKARRWESAADSVGAAIWYTVRVLAKVEIGDIAIAVGAQAGGGVKLGSGNRGGRGYQLLAVFLTYLAVAANYTPDAYRGFMNAWEKHHQTQHSSDASTTGGSER